MSRFGNQSGKSSTGLVVFLLFALLVVYELMQFGPPMFAQFQFQDGVIDVCKFSVDKPAPVVQNEVMAKANEVEVPVALEQIDVTRQKNRTQIKVQYELTAEWLPGRRYKWTANVDESCILF